jgi:hypothetical protein
MKTISQAQRFLLLSKALRRPGMMSAAISQYEPSTTPQTPLVATLRSFHSSPQVEFPVRRRRRPTSRTKTDDSESSSEHNLLKHQPVTDVTEFSAQASFLLDKVERGLKVMKEKNDPFIITRSHGDVGEVLTLDLGPKEGQYRIEISISETMFEYTSPISGKILYNLSDETREWVGVDDGHLFEGILVRDLIRHCRGLPKL